MEPFAWPIAVILIAFGFMLIFRSQIGAFLGRVKEVTSKGIRAESQEPPPPTDSHPSTVEDLMRAFDNVLLVEREGALTQDLQARGIADPTDKVRVLTRYLAGAQIALAFEHLDNVIWGSQLDLVRAINTNPQGMAPQELRVFYDAASAAFPDAYQNYPFHGYLKFLVDSGLITPAKDHYVITTFGREFLVYLASMGRPGWRPF